MSDFPNLQSHKLGYTYRNQDFIVSAATLGTGIPYAIRHFELLTQKESENKLGHLLLGTAEFIPVIGGLVGLVEKTFASCFGTSRKKRDAVTSKTEPKRVPPPKNGKIQKKEKLTEQEKLNAINDIFEKNKSTSYPEFQSFYFKTLEEESKKSTAAQLLKEVLKKKKGDLDRACDKIKELYPEKTDAYYSFLGKFINEYKVNLTDLVNVELLDDHDAYWDKLLPHLTYLEIYCSQNQEVNQILDKIMNQNVKTLLIHFESSQYSDDPLNTNPRKLPESLENFIIVDSQPLDMTMGYAKFQIVAFK